jgi:hypothetical protein
VILKNEDKKSQAKSLSLILLEEEIEESFLEVKLPRHHRTSLKEDRYFHYVGWLQSKETKEDAEKQAKKRKLLPKGQAWMT